MSRFNTLLVAGIAAVAVLTLAACGGGGGSSGSSSSTPPKSTSTTAGLWQGTISSSTGSQTSGVVGLVAPSGQSMWMTADGRVLGGHVPLSGTRFNTTMIGYMYPGSHFPDGSNYGQWSMSFDHSGGMWGGHYSGAGDTGTFNVGLSPMWTRPASLAIVAGTYTRTVSYGYAMTMTIDANGQLSASDTRGCLIDGTVTVPDPDHNLYLIAATVTSCGTLNGSYTGMGTLVDADAMHDWLYAMQPFDCGWYSMGGWMHGGMMGGWQPPPGQNTIPGGTHNLFMFSLVNNQNAIMDALAR